MLRAKTRAAGTAPRDKHQAKSYQGCLLLSNSNFKDDIGELLWSLQFPVGELSQAGWQLFERLLRRYVGLRLVSQDGSGVSG